jgi:CRISPR-associated RAMP protein (TIGR02581 family)
MALHCRHLERLMSLTILHGTLACETGMHIGTGEQVAPGASDLPVVKDAVGRPFVPGSSLKGVLRSYAERLVNSLMPVAPDDVDRLRNTCTSCILHTESRFCLSTYQKYRDDFSRKRERDEFPSDHAMTDWIRQHTCAVCQFFGSPYLAGRVWVKDAFMTGAAPSLEVRHGVAIDRDRRAAAALLLFDVEVVPPTSTFCVEIRVENADHAELGLLFLILDQLQDGALRLGGRGTAGMGRVTYARSRIVHLAADHHSDATYCAQLLNYVLGQDPGVLPDTAAAALWRDCKAAFGQWIQRGWNHA